MIKKLTNSDLENFQKAVFKDYGIRLEGKELYDAAFNLLQFFEALIKFDKEDKNKKEKEVLKSS